MVIRPDDNARALPFTPLPRTGEGLGVRVLDAMG